MNDETALAQAQAEQRALRVRVLVENLDTLARAAHSAREQADVLGLARGEVAHITEAVSVAQMALRQLLGGVPARTLRQGDVIPNPVDPTQVLAVVDVLSRRNGSLFVGAGDSAGHRHSLSFKPDEIVRVFDPRP